jgi:hypothetical protein
MTRDSETLSDWSSAEESFVDSSVGLTTITTDTAVRAAGANHMAGRTEASVLSGSSLSLPSTVSETPKPSTLTTQPTAPSVTTPRCLRPLPCPASPSCAAPAVRTRPLG